MSQVAVAVRPTDPVFFIALAARTRDGDENPRKWVHGWKEDPMCMTAMRENLRRTDARGNLCQRIVIEPEKRGPGANGQITVGPGADWEAIDDFRKHVLIEAVLDRRKEDREVGRPELTVGFYVDAGSDGMPGLITNHMNQNSVPNLDKDSSRWDRKWLPWVDCGILSEIWYDAGSRDDRWDGVRNLLEDQKARHGLHGGTEAIRWNSRDGRNYDWAAYIGVPMWCISRYILYRDPQNLLSWPDHAEVHIMNSAHRLPDGTSGLLTVEQARDYGKRGWTVGSWTRWHDADALVNLPKDRG